MRIPGSDARVLLVDDSAVMRKVILRTLNEVGLDRVVEAGDGGEAAAAFRPGEFGLVIADWNMPIKDGLELIQEIRRVDTEVPILMVTTVRQKQKVLAAIESGVTDFLAKPFEPEDLKVKLVRILSLPVAH